MMERVMAVLLGAMVACGAWADPAGRILENSGVKGGLVVVIGECDTALLAELGARNAYVVQGLDTVTVRVAKARKQLESKGLSGRVSVSTFDREHLP